MRNKKDFEKKTSVILMAPMILPVPAIKGGAIEQLLTSLIKCNEKYGKLKLCIIAKEDAESRKYAYKQTKIYRYNNLEETSKDFKCFKLRYQAYRLWYRCFHNRIAKKFLKKQYTYMTPFAYIAYLCIKKEKANVFIKEGSGTMYQLQALNEVLGKENIFYHVHFNHQGDETFEKYIKNSISISEYVKKGWINGQQTTGTHLVLYNGIDINQFQLDDRQTIRDEMRTRLGYTNDDIVCVYCGRIIEVKGVMQLLDAFDIIQSSRIKLLVIGSVNFGEPKIDEYSQEVIKKIEKNENIQYLGYIPNSEMPKYYALSDIQVIPSIWQEGAGLVAIEGMASGLPLIITKSGGMVEYVSADCSLQVPIDDNLSKNLASAIKTLAQDPILRQKLGGHGIKRATLFSEDNYYNNFVRLIDSICRQN